MARKCSRFLILGNNGTYIAAPWISRTVSSRSHTTRRHEMRIEQLERGNVSKFWIVPEIGDEIPSELRRAQEARVWKDESSDAYFVKQDQCVLQIEGKST